MSYGFRDACLSEGQGTAPACGRSFMISILSSKRAAPAPQKTDTGVKLSPTVVPFDGFNPKTDAEVLRKAIDNFKSIDKEIIISILANRTNIQRQEIASQFETLYHEDLTGELKSVLSGDFEDLVVAMMMPLSQYHAKELHDAMEGFGTDESVLIEVLCTMSNREIRDIQQAYGTSKIEKLMSDICELLSFPTVYGRTLESDLRDETSGCFKNLMVFLCAAVRDESTIVNLDAAQADARELYKAGELRWGTDESTFNRILVQRSVPQLRQIFHEYNGITGHGIEKAIEKEFSGDIKEGLLAIVKCTENRAAFFAEQLHKSMKGIGTKDSQLIRIVVTRSEIDMGEIKLAFSEKYNKSLKDYISGDCSGGYKTCLCALID